MIRAVIGLAVLAWTLAMSAAAQPLPVYSGEHGAFTRIVVARPRGADWSLAAQDDGRRYRLDISGVTRPFALTDIFRRIGTERITDIRAGDAFGSLVFDLACACPPRVDTRVRGHLVLDFAADNPPLAEAPIESGSANAAEEIEAEGSDQRGPQFAASARNTAAEQAAAALPPPAQDVPPTEANAAEAFRSAILEQFSAAISAGVLDAADPELADYAIEQLAGDTEAAPTTQTPREQLHGSGESDCAAYNFLDTRVRDEDDSAGYERVAALRRELLDGGGRFDQTTLRALIHAYLSLGIGQEALQLLRRYDGPDHADLARLAHLVDHPAEDVPKLAGHIACGDDGHVWAVFAPGADPSLIDPDSVLSAFDTWPDTLQERLGAPLARNLRQKGLSSAARRLVARLERRPEDFSDALRLEALKLSENAATGELRSLRHSPDEAVAVESVQQLAAQPGSPDEAAELADLTEAMMREYRGSSAEPGLFVAHVEALIGAGAYEAAFDTLQTGADRAGGEVERLIRRVVGAALDDGNAPRVLSFLLTEAEALSGSPHLTDESKVAVARRLIAAGLPEAGERVLAGVTSPRAARGRRLVQAEAALALRQPERAEIALIGLTGNEVDALRRRAREMMGDFAYLDSQPAGALPEESRRDAAVLAGNWPELAAESDTDWAEIATLMQEGPGRIDPDSLEDFEALASGTAQARRAIADLLQRTDLQPE